MEFLRSLLAFWNLSLQILQIFSFNFLFLKYITRLVCRLAIVKDCICAFKMQVFYIVFVRIIKHNAIARKEHICKSFFA